MIVHAWRRPFAVDPLMAEAKRRMRQRRLFVALAVAVLVGGTVGGWLELRSTSHFAATRPVGSAFAKGNSAEAGGRPAWGLDGGVRLQFIPAAPFKTGVELTNDASQPVTLTDVRAVFPRHSVLRQLGTALIARNAEPCATPSCPAPSAGIFQPNSNGAIRPTALPVAAGETVGVQLNFRFAGCPAARHGDRSAHPA
jgi:hypothetical protein